MRKERSLLYVVVGDELQLAALGKDGCFVVYRAIFEMKNQAGCDFVAMDCLGEVTDSKHMSVFCSQGEKTVEGAFWIAYGDLLCLGVKLTRTKQGSSQGQGSKMICERLAHLVSAR